MASSLKTPAQLLHAHRLSLDGQYRTLPTWRLYSCERHSAGVDRRKPGPLLFGQYTSLRGTLGHPAAVT